MKEVNAAAERSVTTDITPPVCPSAHDATSNVLQELFETLDFVEVW